MKDLVVLAICVGATALGTIFGFAAGYCAGTRARHTPMTKYDFGRGPWQLHGDGP